MKTIIAYIFLTFPLTISAQINLRNISLTNQDTAILYKGIDNVINVTGIELDSTYTLLSSTNKVFRPNIELTGFYVSVRNNKFDTLKLFKKEILLFSKCFSVDTIPNPIAQLGVLMTNIASVQEIISNPLINVLLPNCYFKHSFQVVNFDLTISGKKSTKFLKTNGNKLNTNQIHKIKQLVCGDQLKFENILINCPYCTALYIDTFKITIK